MVCLLASMTEDPNSKALEAAISRKCGGIVSLKMVWARAAEKALANGVSEATVVCLVESLRSPRNLEFLVDVKGRGLDSFLDDLKNLADDSVYRLADWVEAFEHVQAQLVKEGRAASPDSIVGFVHCSAESASGGGDELPLASIVVEMLDRYGFEGQEGCAAG